MPLRSNLFREDRLLEACLTEDAAHIRQGTQGLHVAKIQAALTDLDNARITDRELDRKLYGPQTAAAVLAYKQKRKIVNHSYQERADNIVGRMTIAALDKELVGKQQFLTSAGPRVCPRGSK